MGVDFLEKFESNVNELVNSSVSFKNKIEKIDWLLVQECDYWNKRAEEGISSKIKNFCSEAIVLSVNKEISSIKQRLDNPEKRKQSLEEIKTLISNLGWLPGGVKSNIHVRVSFASIQ